MIFVFYGEETYLSFESVKKLKNKFLEKYPDEGNLLEFDCDESCEINDIINAIGEQSLFAKDKMIIVKNIFANTKSEEQKKLLNSLQNISDDTIIFWENGKIRKNSTLFKSLNKNAKLHESKLLTNIQLEQWIKKTISDNGGTIDIEAIKELITFVGNDLWAITREIEKLLCFVNKDTIKKKHVHNLVHGKTDADMFNTIAAIAARDKYNALTLLKKQIIYGDDPFYIFNMYIFQVRTLLLIKSVLELGIINNNDIAKATNINPYVIGKSRGMIQNLSYKQINKMHKLLTKLDKDIKQGNRDIESALDLFVVCS